MGQLTSTLRGALGFKPAQVSKPTQFTDLPPELRNNIYSLVAADVETTTIRHLTGTSDDFRELQPKPSTHLGLLLANRQINQEVSLMLQRAVHAELYWCQPETDDDIEHRQLAIGDIFDALTAHPASFSLMTHLDIHGSDLILWEMTGDLDAMDDEIDEGRYGPGRKSDWIFDQTLLLLKSALGNLEVLTVFPDVGQVEHFRRRAATETYTGVLLSMFPKLHTINVGINEGVEAVWKKGQAKSLATAGAEEEEG